MESRKRKRNFTQAVTGDDDVLIEVEKRPKKRRKKVARCNKVAIKGSASPGEKIVVTRFDASVDNKPPVVTESESSLRCESATIRASATVRMAPMDNQETWQIGFVQACSGDTAYSEYGENGSAVWTLPLLESGQQVMVNDSFGTNYPFYGTDEDFALFKGPCDMYQEATIRMHDNPWSNNPWCPPVSPNDTEPSLTKVYRKESFRLWLIAKSVESGKAFVLKGVKWNAFSDIGVDPTQPLGKRAHATNGLIPKQPKGLKNMSIPHCALMPPCCNNAHLLTWWPKNGAPQRLIEPECSSS